MPGRGNAELLAWVREHGKPVDSALWKEDEPAMPEDDGPEAGPKPGDDDAAGPPPGPSPGMFRQMRRMTRLYDCKPWLGLVAPEVK